MNYGFSLTSLVNFPILALSGPGGAREYNISESYQTFLSIMAYPENNPKVIVVKKVMRRNGRLERFLVILEAGE